MEVVIAIVGVLGAHSYMPARDPHGRQCLPRLCWWRRLGYAKAFVADVGAARDVAREVVTAILGVCVSPDKR